MSTPDACSAQTLQGLAALPLPVQGPNGTWCSPDALPANHTSTSSNSRPPSGLGGVAAWPYTRSALPLWGLRETYPGSPPVVQVLDEGEGPLLPRPTDRNDTPSHIRIHNSTLIVPLQDFLLLASAVRRGPAWNVCASDTAAVLAGVTALEPSAAALEAALEAGMAGGSKERAWLSAPAPAEVYLQHFEAWGWVLGHHLHFVPESPVPPGKIWCLGWGQ